MASRKEIIFMTAQVTRSTFFRASFWVWISAAAALRLALMPVTVHGDLIFTNYFPYFLSYRGVWDIYGYFGDHYLAREGYIYYAPLVYYVTGAAQWLFKPINPGFEAFMDQTHGLMFDHAVRSVADSFRGFALLDRLRWTFIMKLPYLLAEIPCLFLISKIFKESSEIRAKAIREWLFNPVLIFSVYIFGTYRIYTALAILGMIFLILRGKNATACFLLGVLCLMDNFPILLIAPALLILGQSTRQRLRLLLWMAVPWVALLVPLAIHSKGLVFYAYVSPHITRYGFRGLWPALGLYGAILTKFLFLIFYGWILAHFLSPKRTTPREQAAFFVHASAAVLLAFFGTFLITAHYFMWILPFFVLIRAEGEPWPPWLSGALIALLFFYNLDSRSLNLGLLTPLIPRAMEWPSLHEVMQNFLPWGKFIGLGRLVFCLLSLYFAWKIARERKVSF